MTISVIIPTHRRPQAVKQLLNSLTQQDFPFDEMQVLVVSNLEDPALKKITDSFQEKFYDLKLLHVGHIGVNMARNYGIRFSGGDIYYFLDDDCILNKTDHLQRIREAHINNPTPVGIGGPYIYKSNTNNTCAEVYAYNARKWVCRETSESVKQLYGGNASYKKEIFLKGYAFDNSIIFGGAEVGFNRRLTEDNYLLQWDPSLEVDHNINLNGLEFIKKAFMQGKGKWKNNHTQEERKKLLSSKNNSFLPKSDFSLNSELSSTNAKIYWWLYHVFFKFGVLWAAAQRGSDNKNSIGQSFRFIYLLLKARWSFLKTSYLWRVEVFFQRFRHTLGKIFPLWRLKLLSKITIGKLWVFKIPFHYIKANFWKLTLPFHYIKSNLWRLKTVLIGLLLKLYTNTKTAYYLTCSNAHTILRWTSWPLLKIYYFTQYQINTRFKNPPKRTNKKA